MEMSEVADFHFEFSSLLSSRSSFSLSVFWSKRGFVTASASSRNLQGGREGNPGANLPP